MRANHARDALPDRHVPPDRDYATPIANAIMHR